MFQQLKAFLPLLIAFIIVLTAPVNSQADEKVRNKLFRLIYL